MSGRRILCSVVEGEWENMLEKVMQWKQNVQYILDSCNTYVKSEN